MFTSLRRTAIVVALVGVALGLAACGGDEPAQRKAFIEFLQTRIIDKPGLHIPIMSDQDVANLGPYADQYRIMNGFHHELDATYLERISHAPCRSAARDRSKIWCSIAPCCRSSRKAWPR